MMKMDGRDSAECKNWEKKDIDVIFGIVLSWKRTKEEYYHPLQKAKREKNVRGGEYYTGSLDLIF